MNTEQFFEGPGSATLTTYVWEIAFILIGAFVLGYLLRLMLNASLKNKIVDLEHNIAILKSKSTPPPVDTSLLENKIKEQKVEVDRLNTKLSQCYTDKFKLEQELNTQAQPKETNTSASAQTFDKKETVKDDLTKIEGIGPKIEQILNAEGISSFHALMNADVNKVKKALIAQGPTYAVHNPATWAEQAIFAHNGQWDELDLLQKELKGGQRK